MMRFGRSALLAGMMATVMVLPGCKREDQQVKDQAAKAGQVDTAEQQVQQAGAQQQSELQKAGVSGVAPNPETMQLTDEQKQVLQDRIKNEKDSSYKALLQDVIDRDKQIKELNDKVAKLKSELPKPDVAKAGDNHYALAMRFLRKHGVGEAQAKKLVENVNIMDQLAPGMEVYHFYNNGVYGTWVTRGHAKISPNELNREAKAKIEGERDEALGQNEKLQEEVNDLETQKKQIQSDIEGLRTERAQLIDEKTKLQADNASQLASLNSLHYVVGKRDDLKTKGVIIIPVFAKDRMGPNAKDSNFNQQLDLRSADTITITAADAGVKKIGKVNVVPGSLVKDQHYTLSIAPDGQSATVKILDKERLKNEKVAFAVSE